MEAVKVLKISKSPIDRQQPKRISLKKKNYTVKNNGRKSKMNNVNLKQMYYEHIIDDKTNDKNIVKTIRSKVSKGLDKFKDYLDKAIKSAKKREIEALCEEVKLKEIEVKPKYNIIAVQLKEEAWFKLE